VICEEGHAAFEILLARTPTVDNPEDAP